MKQIYIESYFRSGYTRFMQRINDIFNHPKQQEIETRLKIIEFYGDYGAEATRKAFKKSRSTIYLWKQKLKSSGGKLSSLAPGNRTPKRKRHRTADPFIERFIVEYRAVHPGADKSTITPALTAECTRQTIRPVSESTVGRIIHDLKARGKLPRSNRVTINGRTGKLVMREPRPKTRKMRRRGFVPHLPGDLVQMDTVSVFAAGLKRYIFTAIDVRTRFAFAYAYKTNSSANGDDFLGKFLKVTPFAIKRVQTDNGGEFANHFSRHCRRSCLTHFFNYPHHPQSNGHLERFNRTIQEQYIYWHTDELDEMDSFNQKLMDYLIWYNTEKPHRGIGNLSPLRYYLDNFLPPKKSNMLWTLTDV